MPETDTAADEVTTPAPATEATPESTPEIKDPEALLKTLEVLRTEKKEFERELKALRAQVKETEDAQLSDFERLQQELNAVAEERDRLAREAWTARATSALTAAATKAGAIRPDAVARLADINAVAENGSNADDLIAELRESFPELFKSSPGPADAGSGTGSTPNRSINDLIRQALT